MLFAGTLAGFILALPLFVCGTICLTVRQRTGLWCAWALYIGFALYMRYATICGCCSAGTLRSFFLQ